MRYTWHLHNGAKLRGTTTHGTEEDALDAARRQEARTGPNGETCTATAERRPT